MVACVLRGHNRGYEEGADIEQLAHQTVRAWTWASGRLGGLRAFQVLKGLRLASVVCVVKHGKR